MIHGDMAALRCVLFPLRRLPAVDPTGAGDVFATAFLVRWLADRDPVAAAGFANVVASISVEAPGATGVPTTPRLPGFLL